MTTPLESEKVGQVARPQNNIDLDTISPKDGDIILLRFSIENTVLDEVSHFYRLLEKKFPNNITFAIPRDYSLEHMTKLELRKVIEKLQELYNKVG